jgi:hypothetical protein
MAVGGVAGGATMAAGGVGLGLATVGTSAVVGSAMLGRQAFTDSKRVANRAGAAAQAASSELEAQTIAYITGDNRVVSSGGSTCPF